MGTQWNGMGRDLMQIDSFHQSILRSTALLKPYDINLYDLLMNSNDDTFNNMLYSFISIAAIQVSLAPVIRGRTRLLTSMRKLMSFIHSISFIGNTKKVRVQLLPEPSTQHRSIHINLYDLLSNGLLLSPFILLVRLGAILLLAYPKDLFLDLFSIFCLQIG